MRTDRKRFALDRFSLAVRCDRRDGMTKVKDLFGLTGESLSGKLPPWHRERRLAHVPLLGSPGTSPGSWLLWNLTLRRFCP
ncbi:MAG: hypothetical protein D6812_16045 [Deltaproteobacteria bacterium]|nr:MAG: hypothetical protein D6812_16045 [Deltaproteobacteria bacterium]